MGRAARDGEPIAGRIAYSDHFVSLAGRIEVAAARVAAADPDRRAAVVAEARRLSARLSARLDGSPLTEETAAVVDARESDGRPPLDGMPPIHGLRDPALGGWARTLKLEGMPTQEVAAVEYANLLATFDAEPRLAPDLFSEPMETLGALHGLICRGLTEPEVEGRVRRTEQAIHDGAQGKVIHHPVPVQALPGLLEQLAEWLGRGSAGMPTVVLAGVLHERLLEWQPFEAANGRLARAAARLVLRARGLDPHGVAVPERQFAADPVGYHREVAATARRRGDLGPWLERWGDALCHGMEAAAAGVDPRPPTHAPARADAALRAWHPGERFTLRDYAERAGVDLGQARADLAALEAAGAAFPEPGTRALRWRRRDEQGSEPTT